MTQQDYAPNAYYWQNQARMAQQALQMKRAEVNVLLDQKQDMVKMTLKTCAVALIVGVIFGVGIGLWLARIYA